MDLVEHTARELIVLIETRSVSVRDVVQAHLERIAERNPEVNAIVAMYPFAEILSEADRLDTVPPSGPLHGLPVVVKDLHDVAGLPTRHGSLVTSDRPAAQDGLIAERLRSAGAVIIGKTNTPEFGTGSHTFNEVHGITRNPWDLSRSAGGSSGGAAAALASGMVPIADGSDLGGSLRNPAAFCGVVGLRPSIGRVPQVPDRSTHLLRLGVQGPMARTVADTGLLLSALAGADRRDPLSIADDPSRFADEPAPIEEIRLAWAADLGLFSCEREVVDICRSAAERITRAGGSFRETSPDLRDSMNVFRVLRGLGYRDLGAQIPLEQHHLLKDTVRQNIEYGNLLTIDQLLEAERQRASLHLEMEQFFEHQDVLALPAAQVTAFPVEHEYPTDIEGVEMADYLDWMTTCCVITPTGCPAISIPAGVSSSGLPVGLQLVVPVGAEHRLLRIAAMLERPFIAPPASDRSSAT